MGANDASGERLSLRDMGRMCSLCPWARIFSRSMLTEFIKGYTSKRLHTSDFELYNLQFLRTGPENRRK